MIVTAGQLWADKDKREVAAGKRQRLRVIGKTGGIFIQLRNEETGTISEVRADRNMKGFVLVEEAGTKGHAAPVPMAETVEAAQVETGPDPVEPVAPVVPPPVSSFPRRRLQGDALHTLLLQRRIIAAMRTGGLFVDWDALADYIEEYRSA